MCAAGRWIWGAGDSHAADLCQSLPERSDLRSLYYHYHQHYCVPPRSRRDSGSRRCCAAGCCSEWRREWRATASAPSERTGSARAHFARPQRRVRPPRSQTSTAAFANDSRPPVSARAGALPGGCRRCLRPPTASTPSRAAATAPAATCTSSGPERTIFHIKYLEINYYILIFIKLFSFFILKLFNSNRAYVCEEISGLRLLELLFALLCERFSQRLLDGDAVLADRLERAIHASRAPLLRLLPRHSGHVADL